MNEMGPLDDIILRGFLATDSSGRVFQKEDDKVEYKEVFENGSKEAKAKYAKEMAALYNYEGGYLIFGVNDASELVGLKGFTEPDNAELVNDINNYFSPAIRFQSKKIAVGGKDIFVIYIEKRNSIPTVCIKSHQVTLKEGTIYWRYSAQSAPITAGDLIHLLNSLKGEDSKEIVEIAKKDFRSKFKPRLELNGPMKNGNEVKFRIENRGEIAHVDSFEILESNCKQIFPPTWKDYPISKEHGAQALVKLDMQWQQAKFKLAINYHDDEGHKYQSIIGFVNGKIDLETRSL
jgi:hypothetical protein